MNQGNPLILIYRSSWMILQIVTSIPLELILTWISNFNWRKFRHSLGFQCQDINANCKWQKHISLLMNSRRINTYQRLSIWLHWSAEGTFVNNISLTTAQLDSNSVTRAQAKNRVQCDHWSGHFLLYFVPTRVRALKSKAASASTHWLPWSNLKNLCCYCQIPI